MKHELLRTVNTMRQLPLVINNNNILNETSTVFTTVKWGGRQNTNIVISSYIKLTD